MMTSEEFSPYASASDPARDRPEGPPVPTTWMQNYLQKIKTNNSVSKVPWNEYGHVSDSSVSPSIANRPPCIRPVSRRVATGKKALIAVARSIQDYVTQSVYDLSEPQNNLFKKDGGSYFLISERRKTFPRNSVIQQVMAFNSTYLDRHYSVLSLTIQSTKVNKAIKQMRR